MAFIQRLQTLVKTVFSTTSLARQSTQLHRVPKFLGGLMYSTNQEKLPVIYMFTKDNCSLCVDAKVVLKAHRHRFHLKEVDITKPENKDWHEKYKYDIPVFHLENSFLFKHKVDLTVLETALKDYENKT